MSSHPASSEAEFPDFDLVRLRRIRSGTPRWTGASFSERDACAWTVLNLILRANLGQAIGLGVYVGEGIRAAPRSGNLNGILMFVKGTNFWENPGLHLRRIQRQDVRAGGIRPRREGEAVPSRDGYKSFSWARKCRTSAFQCRVDRLTVFAMPYPFEVLRLTVHRPAAMPEAYQRTDA